MKHLGTDIELYKRGLVGMYMLRKKGGWWVHICYEKGGLVGKYMLREGGGGGRGYIYVTLGETGVSPPTLIARQG